MFWSLFDRFFPDESPESVHRWRRSVGVMQVVTLLALISLAAILTVGVPLAGRVAWADEIDKKVSEAVKATDEKIEAVAKEQRATSKVLKNVEAMLLENLMESTSAKIRSQVAKRCKTEGRVEREEINREIDRLQKQYKTYSGGEKYDEPTCNEI